MNLKNFSIILIVMSLCMGVTGFIYAKAGNKEAVLVNGYPVYEGDTIVATYSMETGDRVLSGYYSVINYNQDILEIYDVVSDEEHLSYSNNAKNEFRIIKTDAIDGFSYNEKTDVVKIYFKVKNTNEPEYNITYKVREIYEYDKETMIDTPVADYKDMTFMQLSFFTSENEDEEPDMTEEPAVTEEPEEATEEPVITEEPEEATEEPAVIEEDEVPEAPEATELPEEEPKEEVTEEPAVTEEPVITEEPVVVTEAPAKTERPVIETVKPAETKAPANNNNNSGNSDAGSDAKSFDDYYDEYFDNGPSVIIDDEGEVLADTPSYITGTENAIKTGDKTDVKSTVVMIIASLFGCGGIGGLILSTKRGY